VFFKQTAHIRQQSLALRVSEQIGALGLARVILDFDGSILSAEGTPVGFNRKKKGRCGDYPVYIKVRASVLFSLAAKKGSSAEFVGGFGVISAEKRRVRTA